MKQVYVNCKFCVSIFILQILVYCGNAQSINLVVDPSFEDTLLQPNYYTQLSLKYWKNLDSNNAWICGTTYFSITNSNPAYRLPINQWANQYPRSGGGVVVFDNYFHGVPQDWHGITRTQLKSKLIAGKTYCAKIFAVFGERSPAYITDGLQLYFDNGGLDTMITKHNDSTGIYPWLVPQVSLNKVLTDTVNWNLVMGSFVANGTEEFLTIGNFKTNANTNYVQIHPLWGVKPYSELFVDDVCVYPIDLANWLPDSYSGTLGDSIIIGLPNYETPDAKWYTYNMQLIDSGSQIKVMPTQGVTKYICGIDLCNTTVLDTVTVVGIPLSLNTFSKAKKLIITPNPTNSHFTVTQLSGQQVFLINTIGVVVQNQKAENGIAQFDVNGLAKGMYVVKCGMQVGKVFVE